MTVAEVLALVLGSVLILYAPGAAWVRTLLPGLKTRIERVVFSVAISICALVLIMSLGDIWFGVNITAVNTIWIALGLTTFGWAVAASRARFGDRIRASR